MVPTIAASTPGANSNCSGDRAHSTAVPYLWVSDVIAAQPLLPLFHGVFSLDTAPEQIPQGRHIICLDPSNNADAEAQTKAIAYKLMAAGCEIGVHELHVHPLAWLCRDWREASELTLTINEFHRPYREWAAAIEYGLKIDEALALAKLAIQELTQKTQLTQRNIELESLRVRCNNMFEKRWEKFIRDLEAEIHAAANAKGTGTSGDRKRLELKAIDQERDSCTRRDRVIEFCRRTGWSKTDVEQEIQRLKTSTITPKAKRLKGKDFLALETESISWVFPGIIPSRGVFVIGGHAGAGKTTFAYDAVGSLLLGEEFLGEKPVKTGKVLVVTGDELPCFSQDKLINRGIPLDNEDWEIILNWDVSQWSELEEAIADIRPALVVIDSFSSIHRDPSFDENSSQAKSTIYDLEALTNAYGCGCILIHHLSKSKENQGVAKLRGSSAISAAASVVCLMEERGDGTRKLSFPKVRGAQTEPFLTQLDGSTGRYEVVSGGDDPGTKTLGNRILAFLQKSPYSRYEQEEISQALGIPLSNKDSVYQALARLFKRGLITKRPSKNGSKRKVYGVVNPSQLAHAEGLRSVTVTLTDKSQDTHTPPPLKVSVKNAKTVDSKDVELTDTLTDNLTDTKLTPQNDVSVDSSSNAGSEGDSVKLTNTDSQGCVCPELVTVTQETVTQSVSSPDPITGSPTAEELPAGTRVESTSTHPDRKNLKGVQLTVVGISLRHPRCSAYDSISCQLPDGTTKDFARHSLKRV
jgi:hypothetical protein